MNVTVIGFGGMGQVLAAHFSKKHHVNVHDKRKVTLPIGRKGKNLRIAEKLQEALIDADVMFLCIRGPFLAEFLTELAKHVGSHQLIVDICSVKTPVANKLRKMPCRVASVHPMFGPKTQGLEEKDVIVISDIGTQKDQEMAASFFHPAKTARMTVQAHDRLMAEIQALPVLLNLAFAESLSAKPPVFPPNFLAQWTASQKIFSDDGDLLDELLDENPYAVQMAKTLARNAAKYSGKSASVRSRIQKARLLFR